MSDLYDDTRELGDDETVTQTLVTTDGYVLMGVDPFEPIDGPLCVPSTTPSPAVDSCGAPSDGRGDASSDGRSPTTRDKTRFPEL